MEEQSRYTFYGSHHGKHDYYVGFESENSWGINQGGLASYNRWLKEIDELERHIDYTIHGSGTETVSHPATMRYWKETNVIDRMYEVMAETGGLYLGGCGTHIHVGRGMYTSVQTYLLAKFVKDNHDRLVKLAHRKSARWAAKITDRTLESLASDKHLNRYQTINFQNSSTFEFRMFKATNNADELRYFIAVAHSIVEYIGRYATTASWESYLAFIGTQERYKIIKDTHPRLTKVVL